ncbi:hypothetical protein CEXT_651161 [Caerostris extrusa]|uniref:Uncharacterized protein n=1 Tax=Caerostris extrusa TaxID=172846 RepID=A0AAV4Y8G2_CAEEX|nr:hypothetical protein CEXT_651161 [Caerostris extrusa]
MLSQGVLKYKFDVAILACLKQLSWYQPEILKVVTRLDKEVWINRHSSILEFRSKTYPDTEFLVYNNHPATKSSAADDAKYPTGPCLPSLTNQKKSGDSSKLERASVRSRTGDVIRDERCPPKYTHTLPYPLMTVPPAERCDKSPCPAKSEPSHNFNVLRPNASWMESIV